MSEDEVCPTCDGVGDVLIGEDGGQFYEPCPTCDGDGVVTPGDFPQRGISHQV